jgi:hypothetical protein
MRVTRLFPLVSLALLLGPVSLVAQSSGTPQNTGVAGIEGPKNGNQQPHISFSVGQKAACPVSLRAQHGADGNIRKVDKNRPDGIAQLLHLIITSNDSRQIVEARLRVRGTSGKGRVDRAESAPGGMDAARNVIARFRPGADNEIVADAWVPGLTAVLQVEVNAVTFADGSTQAFGTAEGCRFTPEHLMLIAGKDGN